MAQRMAARSVFPEKKKNYMKKMNDLLDKFDKILVVDADNVRSQQMHKIRIALRGRAEILMGKNTMMCKVITDRHNRSGSEADKKLYQRFVLDGALKLNVGLVLTAEDVGDIIKIVEGERVNAPARQGAVSTVVVSVPAGNTGLEPTKTSFFQALNIPTKINRGTVEITKDVQILTIGQKVGSSEAALLGMLKISPFLYGLDVLKVYQNGSMFPPQLLAVTDEEMMEKFTPGMNNVASIALALGMPTAVSLPHTFTNAFKNLLCISLGTDYSFKKLDADKMKEAILSGKSFGGGGGGAAAAAPKAKAAAAPAPAPQEQEEEAEDCDFGLFD
eukprot:122644_1